MIEIKDLLSKWENTLLSEEVKKQAIVEAIGTETNIELKSSDLKIQNGTAWLDNSPLNKTEIFLKQEKILGKLNAILGKKAPQSLR